MQQGVNEGWGRVTWFNRKSIMPFEIVRNNLVNMEMDAVVNTANPNPVIGSGVE